MSNPTTVIRPSFFKPLINNYSTTLRLPIGFVRKHRNILPENVKLRIRSGKIWNVKIEETDDDEECFFTKGWSDFVKDLELHEMQMLVFWLNAGDGIFDVSVYDPDSNERELSAVDFRGNIGKESTGHIWKFVREVREQHFTVRRMIIPKPFALGIKIAIGCNIELEDSRGRKWPITITGFKGASFAMTRGFADFMIGNNVKLGDILLFESVANSVANVLKVVVMAKETGEEMLARSGKGGIVMS